MNFVTISVFDRKGHHKFHINISRLMRQFLKETKRFTTFFFYRSKGRKFVVCRENTNSCRKRRSFRRKTRTTSQKLAGQAASESKKIATASISLALRCIFHLISRYISPAPRPADQLVVIARVEPIAFRQSDRHQPTYIR